MDFFWQGFQNACFFIIINFSPDLAQAFGFYCRFSWPSHLFFGFFFVISSSGWRIWNDSETTSLFEEIVVYVRVELRFEKMKASVGWRLEEGEGGKQGLSIRFDGDNGGFGSFLSNTQQG